MPRLPEPIPDALRRLVAQRAGHRCEYCGIAQSDTLLGCEVDHIISRKHGGQTVMENLAFACFYCNRHKGSDIASLSEDGRLTRLFNPRADSWDEHFQCNERRIEGKTPVGNVTVRLLQFNLPDRQLERSGL